MSESDLALARMLQDQFDQEANSEIVSFLPEEYRSPEKKTGKMSVVSDEWETIDPTPDLHALFLEFNQTFFWGRLLSCEVRWSPRMTTCAGICRYFPRERFCTIGISIPLLKLRPRKDMVETLLHEMIHAYLFVTDNNDDHDGHGPEFHKHMYRINKATGANISVYHTFHDEVALYKQHWWRCSGSCTKRPPFFGIVKRSMNRAPGPNDRWWKEHENSCGGTFNKIKEPEGYGKKKGKENKKDQVKPSGSKDIRSFIQPGGSSSSQNNNTNKGKKDPNQGTMTKSGKGKPPAAIPGTNKWNGKTSPTKRKRDDTPGNLFNTNKFNKAGGSSPVKGKGGGRGNIFGFGGTSFSSSGKVGVASPVKGKGGGRGNIFGFGGTSFSGSSSPAKPSGSSGGSFIGRPGDKPRDPASNMPMVMPANIPTTAGSSQGVSLGGGSSTQHDTMSARERARLKWASTNVSSSSQTNNIVNSDKHKDTNSKSTIVENTTVNKIVEKSNCPVCSKLIDTSKINEHLDVCLTASSDFSSPSKDNTKISNSPNKSSNCDKVINLDDLDDQFNDSDDDLLSQALDDAESSINDSLNSPEELKKGKKSTKRKGSTANCENNTSTVISIESSGDESESDEEPFVMKNDKKDDNEPLIKKRNIDINDSLNQDDMDMMAALSDQHQYSNEEFACPACKQLVPSKNINTHLDACLSGS